MLLDTHTAPAREADATAPPDGRFAKLAATDGRTHASATILCGRQRAADLAASAAVALHRENQRLHARLRTQMAEVRASRARLVAAADAERRRLERDLHDGAQARFVAVALQLRRAQAQAPAGSEVAELLEAAIGEIATGLEELRELARGIHPAVLSERGLDAALQSLVHRAPVPVEIRGAVGARLDGPVEIAAYFAVSEALANVAKYAEASRVTVEVARADGRLAIEVIDDGRGGACADAGSGLRGLADRVGALDGRLEVHSPRGAGTRVRVEIPCAAPVAER